MRVGSLCSGYGGLDMAVEHVTGARVIWCADNARGPAIVQAARYGVPNHGDIKRINWRAVDPIDILTAGYPCQPFSAAGRKRGTADERHLWPYVAKAIRHLRPQLVILENVANHRRIGFGDVLGDLAAMRYDARWTSVRAFDVGAAHRRERLFVIAYPADSDVVTGSQGPEPTWRRVMPAGRRYPTAPHRGSEEQPCWPGLREGEPSTLWGAGPGNGADDCGFDWQEYGPAVDRWARIIGRRPPRPVVRGAHGGKAASARFIEWHMGLAAGWVTDVQGLSTAEQIELLGNGVVPQQAEAALRELLSEACGVAA